MAKTIIAGSRNFVPYADCFPLLTYAIKLAYAGELEEITEVVSGKAKGADHLGEIWATINNVPVKEFPADWKNHGKSAGPIRNTYMGEYADQALILWDGQSAGTKHMIRTMKILEKPCYVLEVKGYLS